MEETEAGPLACTPSGKAHQGQSSEDPILNYVPRIPNTFLVPYLTLFSSLALNCLSSAHLYPLRYELTKQALRCVLLTRPASGIQLVLHKCLLDGWQWLLGLPSWYRLFQGSQVLLTVSQRTHTTKAPRKTAILCNLFRVVVIKRTTPWKNKISIIILTIQLWCYTGLLKPEHKIAFDG